MSPVLTGRRCQCTACGDYFNSDTGFDRHRVGHFQSAEGPSARRCLSADEMTAKGWIRNAAGFWITKAREAVTTRAEASPTT